LLNATLNFTPELLRAPGRHADIVVSVKDLCTGMVGQKLLFCILFLIGINIVAGFFWRKLLEAKFIIKGREYSLTWALPLINYCVLGYAFVLAYNAF